MTALPHLLDARPSPTLFLGSIMPAVIRRDRKDAMRTNGYPFAADTLAHPHRR
jgi:hypothetical protein